MKGCHCSICHVPLEWLFKLIPEVHGTADQIYVRSGAVDKQPLIHWRYLNISSIKGKSFRAYPTATRRSTSSNNFFLDWETFSSERPMAVRLGDVKVAEVAEVAKGCSSFSVFALDSEPSDSKSEMLWTLLAASWRVCRLCRGMSYK